MDNRLSFFEFTRRELADRFEGEGLPRYRAEQLYTHVYQRGATTFEEMTDLPKPLRARLAETFTLEPLHETGRLVSPGGDTIKHLWELPDGKGIESVRMRAGYGETICFSTQVGCAFMCGFCITAKMGRLRNLTPGEIVAQATYLLRREPPLPEPSPAEAPPSGEIPADPGSTPPGPNLVAMGMGEPLDNLDALLKALAILHDDRGLNVSGRRITVSTVGVVPGILRLAREDPSVGLALSLNATTDPVRAKIMPVTRKWPIAQVLDAVEKYAAVSDRRITLEYVLIKGLNDTPADAERLGRIAERFPSKVNVIPFNPSELFDFERPSPEEVDAFARRLWRNRTTVTVRYSKGLDILAACGQLGYGQVKAKLAAGV